MIEYNHQTYFMQNMGQRIYVSCKNADVVIVDGRPVLQKA